MNTYSAQLSKMARTSADQFRQTDIDLARQSPASGKDGLSRPGPPMTVQAVAA
jgi:hypothetical protein